MIYAIVVALKRKRRGNTDELCTGRADFHDYPGITISVGGFICGAATCGDYNRYSKDAVSAVLSSFRDYPVGRRRTAVRRGVGNHDRKLRHHGDVRQCRMPIIRLLVLILATWTTNVGNAYSAGIDLVNILKLKDDKRALVTPDRRNCRHSSFFGRHCLLLRELPLDAELSDLTDLCDSGGRLLDHGERKKHENWEPFEGVNWLGIIAWLAGRSSPTLIPFVPEIIGIIGAMIIYTCFASL